LKVLNSVRDMRKITVDEAAEMAYYGADVVCSGDEWAARIYTERATASELGRIFDKEAG